MQRLLTVKIISSSPSTSAQVCRCASAGSVKPKPLFISPARYGIRKLLLRGSFTLSSNPGVGPNKPLSWATLREPNVSRAIVSSKAVPSLPPHEAGWVMSNTFTSCERPLICCSRLSVEKGSGSNAAT